MARMVTYNWLWGYLIPIGFAMLVWAGLPPRQRRRLAPAATLATALAVLGYWAAGFALHMGGAYPVTEDGSLEALRAMFSLVSDDPGWGIAGLAGFFLSGPDLTPEVRRLFLVYLPLIATAVTLVTVALSQARRWVMVAAGALAGAVVVPVAACWTWGSGWLSHLGATMGMGSGFVDFGGSALILWLPGMLVLPILLLQRPRPDDAGPGSQNDDQAPAPPANYAPLVSSFGALLAGVGWLGWSLSTPFHVSGAVLDWQQTAINVLVGMAGAAVTAHLYGWLATGKLETLISPLGLSAGWGALLATAPFVPVWAALMIGLLTGLLFPLAHHAAYRKLRDHSGTTVVALALTGGLLGTLGSAVLADGRWGQGWNGMGHGLSSDGAVVGSGVAGIFVTGDTQQLSAQAIGLLALAAWGLVWGTAIGFAARVSSRRLPAEQTSTPGDEDTPPLGARAEPSDVAEPLPTPAPPQAPATGDHIPYDDPLSTQFVATATDQDAEPKISETKES